MIRLMNFGKYRNEKLRLEEIYPIEHLCDCLIKMHIKNISFYINRISLGYKQHKKELKIIHKDLLSEWRRRNVEGLELVEDER